MARIVLGIGTSHGPLLQTPPEQWDQRAAADRTRAHPFRGGTYAFDELVALRAGENLAAQNTMETRRRRFAECQTALARLAGIFEAAKPDAVVVIGNDQMEIFDAANIPAFMVYYGETIENIPHSEVQRRRLPPGIGIAESGYHGPVPETYPGSPALAQHLIESLIECGFDVAASRRLPELPTSYSSGIPHAYGFVYRRIVKENIVPAVPIFINAGYPPNQPKVSRCFGLGRALARAIEAWHQDARIAIIGSGGMSHFAVDEELDRAFLAAIGRRDVDALLAIPEHQYRSGSAELKNWVPLAGAMQQIGLGMTLIDYVACYRSLAGTGSGMAFAYWR